MVRNRGGIFQAIEDLVVFFRGGRGKNVPTKSVAQALQPVDDGRKNMVQDPTPDDMGRLPVAPDTQIKAEPSVDAIHLAGELDIAGRVIDTPATADDVAAINATLGTDKTLANPPPSVDPASRPAAQAVAANFIANEALQKFAAQADASRNTSLPFFGSLASKV